MHSPRHKTRHPDHHPLILSPSSRLKIRTAIQRSLAPSTHLSYQSAIRIFNIFCDREKIPTHRRTPTPEPLLCAFAADGINQLSGSTIKNRIAALKAWHTSNNWPWLGGDRLIRVIKGVQNATPTSTNPKRPPASIHALETLADNLNHDNPLDLAIFACACTAFWGQCRLGELLPVNHSFDPMLLPLRRAIRYSPGNKDTWVLNLPATKTNRRGQDIILVKQTGKTNPLRALHNHLQKNKNPIDMPLFTFTKDNSLHTLTKKIFLGRCNDIWSQSSFPVLTGHSFRIGGTTHLLLSGVPPDVVKTTGRWSSDAFLKYWRAIEYIAPIHLQDVSTKKSNTTPTTTRPRHWG